jgi:hypothetical protein
MSVGSVAPARGLAWQTRYLRAFFDRFLQGKSSHLLESHSQ